MRNLHLFCPNHVNYVDEALRGSVVKFTGGEDPYQARSIAFWRAMGFRRVGTLHWFCCALDENDPSRVLAAEDDFDPAVGKGPTPVDPNLLTQLVVEQGGIETGGNRILFRTRLNGILEVSICVWTSTAHEGIMSWLHILNYFL
jgi:hypothetical protein